MKALPERLWVALERVAEGRRRVGLDRVWRAFEEEAAHLRGHPGAREELHAALEHLAEQRKLRLPRGASLYDTAEQPFLPRWVELPPSLEAERALEKARDVPWHPTLAFVRELPRLGKPELEALLRIQVFLAEGGMDAELLTVRERSLRLLGDDKRLEKLAEGQLFRPGRLSFKLLRCQLVHAPFVFRDFGVGQAALILENKDTFASACEARARLGERSEVRWLIYGAGNGILQSIASFTEWAERPVRLLYFGDLDAKGLSIALRLRDTCAEQGLPPLEPQVGAYVLLAERATAAKCRLEGQTCSEDLQAGFRAWLPEVLHTAVERLLVDEGRWPQEFLTRRDFEALLAKSTWGAAANRFEARPISR
jgi:hypothetical protein